MGVQDACNVVLPRNLESLRFVEYSCIEYGILIIELPGGESGVMDKASNLVEGEGEGEVRVA